MKNVTLFFSTLLLGSMLAVSSLEASEEVEKQGFLTTSVCAEKGIFADCRLETYMCGSEGCFESNEAGVTTKNVEIVLYSHKEGHTYKIDISGISIADVDGGINRNEITIIGKYDKNTNIIVATDFKAPPPPKKSFFKGCL